MTAFYLAAANRQARGYRTGIIEVRQVVSQIPLTDSHQRFRFGHGGRFTMRRHRG